MTTATLPAPLQGFTLDPTGRAAAFASAQVALVREDPALQRVFPAIQHHVRHGTPSRAAGPPPGRRPLRLPRLPRRRLRGDVLLAPTWLWQRPGEDALLADVLAALLHADLAVLVPMHRGSPLRARLHAAARRVARGRLVLFDPRGLGRRLETLRPDVTAAVVARREEHRVREVLAGEGLALEDGARAGLQWEADRALDWAGVADAVQAPVALVRCHWLPLCSAVAHDAVRRDRRVVTLQQGVVSHSVDVPVVADSYLAVGRPSATLVRRMDAALAGAAGRGVRCGAFHPVGSLVDPVPVPGPDPFGRRRVLVVDQSVQSATRYHGVQDEQDALVRIVEELVTGREPARVLVRPHPNGDALGRWRALAAAHPARLALSDPARPLAADLASASVALGLFSGALAVAAAAGVPPVLLGVDGGFRTPDLDVFAAQRLDEREAGAVLRRLLADRGHHERARRAALGAGRTYLEGGRRCRFDAHFVDLVLAAA